MSGRKRVLLAGLFHETHTFLEGTTGLDEFAVRRGDELREASGDGSPLAGVLEVAESAGWDLLPVIDMRAKPSATVADEVFDVFQEELDRGTRAALETGLDGIYLVLHGAMACESTPDPEGEVVAMLRGLPGAAEIPICGVLDLHGNISRSTMERTHGLIAYARNPHTDAREAAMIGARLLERILTTGEAPVTVFEQPPVMWPPTGTGTADDPMKTLTAMARDFEQAHPEIERINVFGGFSFADTPDTGISFSAITRGDPAAARALLTEMSAWAVAHREAGNVIDTPLADVIPEVREHIAAGETPVVLVEPSDNIGGGAPGDGTTILRALIEHEIDGGAVVIDDAAAVSRLHSLPAGARMALSLGGRGSRLTDGPVELEVELLSTSDGRFDLEDRQSHLASMAGVHIDMGPCAVVQHGGVRILLTSRKTPPFDLGQWRSQGIDPEGLTVIGVKAAVAHRRAYDRIARHSYTVATPGPCASDLTTFPYERIRRPIFPLDAIGG